MPVDEFTAGMREAHVPEEEAALVAWLFTEILDGRNAEPQDGVRRALGRAPRDFGEYARVTAASGAWAGSPVFRTWRGLGVLLWPGRLDVEEFEDVALGVGEAVEADAVVGVGEAEALEGGEDVAAGGDGGAAFGEQAGEWVAVEAGAGLGFDEAEDEQGEADDADQRVDAVVVVQEDRADLE